MHEDTGRAVVASRSGEGTDRLRTIAAEVVSRHSDGTVARVVVRCAGCGARLCDLLFPGHAPGGVAVVEAEVRCPACGGTATRALVAPRRAAVVASGPGRCSGGPWAGIGIACDWHLGRVDAAHGRLAMPHRRCGAVTLDLAEVIRALDLGATPTIPGC